MPLLCLQDIGAAFNIDGRETESKNIMSEYRLILGYHSLLKSD